MDPAVVAQTSHTEYKEGTSLADMLREDLVAERIAVATYREIIKCFGQDDPTSRTMLEAILAQEEEHAAELADLLFAVEPDTDSNTRRLYFADEISGHSDARPGGPYVNGRRCQGKRVSMRMREGIRRNAAHRAQTCAPWSEIRSTRGAAPVEQRLRHCAAGYASCWRNASGLHGRDVPRQAHGNRLCHDLEVGRVAE